MKSDETPTTLDRDDVDRDDAERFDAEGAAAEPPGDDDFLDAELGLFDVMVGEDDVEDELDDCGNDDDDDDRELALLHELGIDLDAPDGPLWELGALVLDDESCFDDEVAA